MTLEKAIEILAEQVYTGSVTFNDDWKGAVKLSIQALKRLRELRIAGVSHPWPLLPGETTE